MGRAFITGATGFIGGHVARVLVENGWSVRALKRQSSSVLHIEDVPGIEWCVGDILDLDQVRRAMKGCRVVFHVAADYRLWAKDPSQIYDSNVRGSANVLESALLNGVENVVYTGSVGALGLTPDSVPADERVPVCLEDMVGHYKRSKFLAGCKVVEYLRKGLPIVSVHPSTPVGPADHKPTPTGRMIVDYLCRRMPAYVDTGLNIVHVRDVAVGHLLALERGRTGEGYILGNRNMTLSEIFQTLEQISGIPAPRIRLPHRLVLALAYCSEGWARITGREPRVVLEGVKMAHRHMYFDAAKAIRELGLPQTPVEQALREAVTWFRENDYIR